MAGGAVLVGFDQVLSKLDGIAAGKFAAEAVKVLAAEALTQTQLGFRQGRDPYGGAWAPPLLRPGGSPLRNTGRLANSYTVAIHGLKIVVASNAIYAAVHQYGATITPKRGKWLRFSYGGRGKGRSWATVASVTIPARQMLPSEGNIGPIWGAAFEKAVSIAWRNFVR